MIFLIGVFLEIGAGIAMGVFFSLWLVIPVVLILGYLLYSSLHQRGGELAWLCFALPLISLVITAFVVRYEVIWSTLNVVLLHLIR